MKYCPETSVSCLPETIHLKALDDPRLLQEKFIHKEMEWVRMRHMFNSQCNSPYITVLENYRVLLNLHQVKGCNQ